MVGGSSWWLATTERGVGQDSVSGVSRDMGLGAKDGFGLTGKARCIEPGEGQGCILREEATMVHMTGQ